MSMIVILPFKSESLLNVLSRLSKIQFSTIIAELERAGKLYKDDEVYVYLPKFKYASDFNLNSVLIQVITKITTKRTNQESQSLDLFAVLENVIKCIYKKII